MPLFVAGPVLSVVSACLVAGRSGCYLWRLLAPAHGLAVCVVACWLAPGVAGTRGAVGPALWLAGGGWLWYAKRRLVRRALSVWMAASRRGAIAQCYLCSLCGSASLWRSKPPSYTLPVLPYLPVWVLHYESLLLLSYIFHPYYFYSWGSALHFPLGVAGLYTCEFVRLGQ